MGRSPSTIGLSLERLLGSPLFKNILVPFVVFYFILRPFLVYIFNRDDAKVLSDKESKSSAKTRSAIAKTGSEFLRMHLESAKVKSTQLYPSQLRPQPQPDNSQARKLSSQGETAAEGQKETPELLKRLKLRNGNVVTASIHSQDACSADLHHLVKSLSPLVPLFILVHLHGADAASIENERSLVLQAMKPLTSGDYPILSAKRVLMSTTVVGRVAGVRQLKSTVHIDFDHSFCRNLEQHVRTIIHINLEGYSSSPTGGADSSPSKMKPDSLQGDVTFSSNGIIQISRYSQLCSIEL